jgi:type I restriction enzyme S subunit
MIEQSADAEDVANLEGISLPPLPSPWCWATPRQLTSTDEYSLAIGPFGSNLKVSDYRQEGVPLIFVRNIRSSEFGGPSTKYASPQKADELAAHSVDSGDILITKMGDPPGDACLYPEGKPRAIITADCIKFRLNNALGTARFFVHALNSQVARRQIGFITKGVAQQKVSLGRFAQLRLPFAPPNEQLRIVSKIEELFSDLDAGVAALERIRANLKRYRAAVLKAAVEGRLTEPSHLGFEKNNWLEIGTVLTCVEQGWSPKCERLPATDHTEWAVMKTSAVQPMQFVEDENKRLPSSLTPVPELAVQPNDLLITRAGPRNRAAVTCLVRSCRPRLIVCDKVYRMRCDPKAATPAFLEVILNSPPILDQLDELKTGISDSGVNLTQQRFRRLKLPLPPLKIQDRIVTEVEKRLSIIAVSEQQIEANLKRSARLRQSILKRAFEGKLVPQDPTDEPAEKLLERIRQERTATNGSVAPRSRRNRVSKQRRKAKRKEQHHEQR